MPPFYPATSPSISFSSEPKERKLLKLFFYLQLPHDYQMTRIDHFPTSTDQRILPFALALVSALLYFFADAYNLLKERLVTLYLPILF